MKFNKHIATVSTVIIATVSSLYAIERSAPAAQPKEKDNQVAPAPRALPNAQKQQLNNGAPLALPIPQVDAFRPFLGVAGTPISEALATQLGLAEKSGITLNLIARNSPASKAGLQKHDIITSLDGKAINSQADLKNAVLARKAGDTIELKYITKGEKKTIQVEIGQASNAPAVQQNLKRKNPANPILPKDFFDKFPPEQREQLKKLLEGNLRNLDALKDLNRLKGKEPQGLNKKPQMFHLQFDDLLKGVQGNGAAQGRLKMMDGNGSITLQSDDKGKQLELRDRAGKLQYAGPFNNEADKLKVPEKFRDRIKQLDPKKALGKANIMTPEQLMKMLGRDLPEMPNLLKNLPPLEGLENGVQGLNLNLQRKGSSTLIDPASGNRFKLKKTENGFEAEALDKEGELLFSGPYNSDFDKNSVPEEFRSYFDNLKNLSTGKPLQFRFGQ